MSQAPLIPKLKDSGSENILFDQLTSKPVSAQPCDSCDKPRVSREDQELVNVVNLTGGLKLKEWAYWEKVACIWTQRVSGSFRVSEVRGRCLQVTAIFP